jgi:hypothetical protein
MATTDQLRKAEQRGGQMALNDFSRDRYVRELEAVGQKGVRGLSKLELFKRVREVGIKIVPDWHRDRCEINR